MAVSPLTADPSEACLEPPADAVAFVIFGATGDLAHRKLIPALYNLAAASLLPKGFAIIGLATTPRDDDSYREEMRETVKALPEADVFNQELWDGFAANLHYISGDFSDPAVYDRLRERLGELDEQHGCCGNRLFYCAVPPSLYEPIARNLASQGVRHDAGAECGPWSRIIVEKPFGYDLKSAHALNAALREVFSENEIFRIDHFLGKETVQNMLAFRFANTIIEPIWNRRYIDHVQITAAEDGGVEHRGRYYDGAGALRDMFQNHLLQLMALVAMDPPVRYADESVRDRKVDVLKSVMPIPPERLADWAVRGQYGAADLPGEGPVKGYRQEVHVPPNSYTETFAALKLMVDNWRWAGVPFYLRSGKRLPRKLTQVSIVFKRVPHLFFRLTPDDHIEPNVITVRIQPDEGIAVRIGAKAPGPQMRLKQVEMTFTYAEAFGVKPATAYETLLLDAMEGDATLFNRSDAVETAWEILAPIQQTWAATHPFTQFPNYAAGTWGPEAADALLAADGHAWRNG